MKRSIADLSPEELDRIAGEAWSEAAGQALGRGLSITGLVNGKRVAIHPDGRTEVLDADPIPETPTFERPQRR